MKRAKSGEPVYTKIQYFIDNGYQLLRSDHERRFRMLFTCQYRLCPQADRFPPRAGEQYNVRGVPSFLFFRENRSNTLLLPHPAGEL